MHAPTSRWLTVLITSRKMSITLLIRFFLNIARRDFDYFGSDKYLYYIPYQLNKDILDFES